MEEQKKELIKTITEITSPEVVSYIYQFVKDFALIHNNK